MTWIWSSLFAGLFQAWRTALQQKLRASLSISGAGFVRYGFGIFFAVTMAWAWLTWRETAFDGVGPSYFLLAAAGGLAQIIGTAFLISSFDRRGFVVGTAFSKTEALQAAVGAALFAGERLLPLAWGGIAIGMAGVLVLALAARGLRPVDVFSGMTEPAALYGLGSAALFAVTGLLIKEAMGLLGGNDPVGTALVTLVVVMAVQTLVHGCWIAIKEPETFGAISRSWKTSGLVGLLSACGSACWFAGFALAPVALVRIVGQVEVVFTMLFAHGLLKEKTRPHEIVALLMVVLGVILALLGGTSGRS